MSDMDGNYYKTIQIGTQIWMAENLRVSKFRTGELIQNIVDNSQWANFSKSAFCYCNNEVQSEKEYGKLYNWFAVNDPKNICPVGWHIPSVGEWNTLVSFLGGANQAGGNLKEIETKHWNSPNADATNSDGFTALPAGFRDSGGDGLFHNFNEVAMYWNGGFSQGLTFISRISNSSGKYETFGVSKTVGASVRCIKD